MDFELSTEQAALRGAAQDLLTTVASRDRVREWLDAPEGHDPDLWKHVAEQGWLAIEVPEDRGGLGLGPVELAVLAEQLGRTVAPAPFLSTSLVLTTLLAASPDAQGVAGEWIERIVTAGAVGCAATHHGPVADAPIADVAVRLVGEEVHLLDLAGHRPPHEPVMDLTRRVVWSDALPESGTPIGGPEVADVLLDRAAMLYATEMLGASERMLEESVEYAKVREQFGRPIGAFQAVKHRLADMLVDVEGMRSAAYYAAWAQAAAAQDRSLAASTAKAWCSDASRRVLDSALQVHGGIGFTWEHDLHLYLKRAQLDQTLHGDATWHRRRVASLLRVRVLDGIDLW